MLEILDIGEQVRAEGSLTTYTPYLRTCWSIHLYYCRESLIYTAFVQYLLRHPLLEFSICLARREIPGISRHVKRFRSRGMQTARIGF
jgi:hypothetical protein